MPSKTLKSDDLPTKKSNKTRAGTYIKQGKMKKDEKKMKKILQKINRLSLCLYR
jgi:hypothetical protein